MNNKSIYGLSLIALSMSMGQVAGRSQGASATVS
jgi:hypothetical protein